MANTVLHIQRMSWTEQHISLLAILLKTVRMEVIHSYPFSIS